MHIVSSQTLVKPLVKIRRQRAFDSAGEVAVRLGQQVTPVQVVARVSEPRGFYVVPAAEMLGVPAGELEKYMLAAEGQAVTRGQPLVRRPGLLSSKQISAPVNGTLYSINYGRLILQTTTSMREKRAMLHGFVANLVSNRGVIIETQGSLIQAMWASGQEGYGRIRVVVDSPNAPLQAEHVNLEARGCVLVAGRLEAVEVLERAEENSVRGLIVGSLPARLMAGLERGPLPVYVTEGFGSRPMSVPIFRLLHRSEGRDACLIDSSDGERSRGRPEIVIPLPTTEEVPVPDNAVQTLQVGQAVRLLRAPYTGQVGKVVAVHTRARTTDLGMRLPGVDVTITNGQTVFVPYLNLDLIG